MVWLECWDCAKEIPVNYEPSGADLPNASGARVTGHLTTFTLGFVAFQLFTVDFIAAEVHDAEVWNTRPPERLRDALTRIWPPQLTVADVQWPQAMFARTDWHSLVTWDGELRPAAAGGVTPRLCVPRISSAAVTCRVALLGVWP